MYVCVRRRDGTIHHIGGRTSYHTLTTFFRMQHRAEHISLVFLLATRLLAILA